jgi:hypothetical protein
LLVERVVGELGDELWVEELLGARRAGGVGAVLGAAGAFVAVVPWSNCQRCARREDGGRDVSRLRHFWQRVEEVAFEADLGGGGR